MRKLDTWMLLFGVTFISAIGIFIYEGRISNVHHSFLLGYTSIRQTCNFETMLESKLESDSIVHKTQLSEHLFQEDYKLSDSESDDLYLGCDYDIAYLRKPIAVVRPFIYSNMKALLENLGYWEMEDLLPCTSSDNIQVDLIFWFHRALECNPTVISAIENVLNATSKARSCFRQVHFLSASIPKELDYYGDGTIMMFYRLFRRQFMQENYGYLFYMESDVYPLQKNWLEALWYHTRSIEPFWQKGGMIRSPNFLSRGWGADYHINGNSLYRLGDKCFNNFLKRVQFKYPHKPYDMAIRAYRLDEARFVEQQRFMHKFIYSDFLHNYGDGITDFSRFEITKKSPNAYFVHSKRSTPGEYTAHPSVESALQELLQFNDTCKESLRLSKLTEWDLALYT